MTSLSLEILEIRGFRIFNQTPAIAILKVAESSFLCLQSERGKWILGHSLNGTDIFFRPGCNRKYQYVRDIRELDLEISWLKLNSSKKAIEISLALLSNTGILVNC